MKRGDGDWVHAVAPWFFEAFRHEDILNDEGKLVLYLAGGPKGVPSAAVPGNWYAAIGWDGPQAEPWFISKGGEGTDSRLV